MIEIRNDINDRNEKNNYVKAKGSAFDIAKEIAFAVKNLGEEDEEFVVGLFPVLIDIFGEDEFKKMSDKAIRFYKATTDSKEITKILLKFLKKNLGKQLNKLIGVLGEETEVKEKKDK